MIGHGNGWKENRLDLAKDGAVCKERRGGVFFLAKSTEDLLYCLIKRCSNDSEKAPKRSYK